VPPQLIDEFLPKVDEWMQRSGGRIRADVVHEKLLALGYLGSERTMSLCSDPDRTGGAARPSAVAGPGQSILAP